MTNNVIDFRVPRERERSRMDALALVDDLIEHSNPSERIALALALATRLSELAALLLGEPPGFGAREPDPPKAAGQGRLLSVDEAARIAGVNRRWIYAHTRGLKFRRDLSRKNVRIEEAGFRRWLESRRRT